VKRIRLSSVAKFPSAFDIHASRPDPLDRIFFDVFVGVNFSFLHAPQKGLIFCLLKLELPVLASGREVVATIVFDLFANLFAAVLIYIAFDRVFNKGID